MSYKTLIYEKEKNVARIIFGSAIPYIPILIMTVGLKRALDLLLTTRLFDGREAAQMGLVTRAVPAERLEEEVTKLVEALCLFLRDGIAIGKASRHLVYDSLGLTAGFAQGYVSHTLFTNLRWEPDEYSYLKERRDKGLGGGLSGLHERYAGLDKEAIKSLKGGLKMGVLEGVKVLDSSQYGTGPYATLLLSFLGAEVIKLEIPSGDPMRAMSTRHKGISYPYALVNLNKKCITLNLKKEEGREIFKKLIRQVDILVENFLPGTMEEWGLSYEVLSEISPGIIYASISGFGRGSKYEKIPAYDPIIQAMGGAMASTGFPGNPPTKAGAAYADFGGSAHLVVAILGALYHRLKTGQGQRIDLAMRDTILCFPLSIHNAYYESKKVEIGIGNRAVGLAPYNTYKAKDGYVYVVGITDAQANSVMKAIGKEDFISSEKYRTAYNRWCNREEIDQMIEEWTKKRTKQEIFKVMSERDVPCSPVLTIEEVWNDEDLIQRGMVVELEQPGMGKIKVLNSPLGIFPPVKNLSPAPLIGQHNREVYCEFLGLTEDEIKKLKDEDTI